jgi:molybdate transport system ATP-binding protein
MDRTTPAEALAVLRLDIEHTLADFSLSIDLECRYPTTALYGPSGAGKTSLLHMIAGLLRPDRGEISVDGDVLFSSEHGINRPPETRGIGYVFQQDLLFPHLSVERNLRYGYDLLPSAARRFAPDQIIELLEIGSLLKRAPTHLSGGERQRVALGRALLSSPRLLLMDEPLAALDQGLKSRIIPYLRHIRTELAMPMLYVSHSVAEILELTGQVIMLERGQVLAHGDFFRIATEPGVLPLLGEHGFENVLQVELLESSPAEGFRRARCGEQELKIPHVDSPTGQRMFIGLRADDIILSRRSPDGLSIRNALRGTIAQIAYVDGTYLIYIDVGRRIAANITREALEELGLVEGQKVFCLIKTNALRLGPHVD